MLPVASGVSVMASNRDLNGNDVIHGVLARLLPCKDFNEAGVLLMSLPDRRPRSGGRTRILVAHAGSHDSISSSNFDNPMKRSLPGYTRELSERTTERTP